MPRWFLILNGVALALMGGMLLYGRLREGGRWGPGRMVGLLWSLLCLAMSAALLMMATGRLAQPGTPKEAPVPRRVVFPEGR